MQNLNIKIYNMKEVLAKIFGGAGVGVAEKLSNIIGQHVFTK